MKKVDKYHPVQVPIGLWNMLQKEAVYQTGKIGEPVKATTVMFKTLYLSLQKMRCRRK